MSRVTDDEARVFAAYHTDDSPCWYQLDPSLLKQRGDDREEFPYDKERDEFVWLRDLAADLLYERAKSAGLVLAINEMLALPVAHATLHQLGVDALKNAGEWQP
jgi:hypothetical protein